MAHHNRPVGYKTQRAAIEAARKAFHRVALARIAAWLPIPRMRLPTKVRRCKRTGLFLGCRPGVGNWPTIPAKAALSTDRRHR